jgi:hypothetical protein
VSSGDIQCHAISQSAKDYQGFSGERLPVLWIDDAALSHCKIAMKLNHFSDELLSLHDFFCICSALRFQ